MEGRYGLRMQCSRVRLLVKRDNRVFGTAYTCVVSVLAGHILTMSSHVGIVAEISISLMRSFVLKRTMGVMFGAPVRCVPTSFDFDLC